MSSTILDRFYDQYARRLEDQRRDAESRASALYKPKFVRIVQKRLAKNKDARIVIAGEGGDGKSTLALRFGELFNPSLYIDKYQEAVDTAVCFSGQQYMNGVRILPSEWPVSPDPLERTVLDYDEPAQSWYHRQFMSEANQILAKTMIGYRYKKFVTPLSVPNVDLLDVDALRLVNWFIWVEKQGLAEVYRVMPQKFGGRPWFKTVINRLHFSTPGAKLWHSYEKKKFAEQDKLHETYGNKMEDLERPGLSRSDILSRIKQGIDAKGQPKNFFKDGALYPPYLMAAFDIGMTKAYFFKATIESEGKPDSKKEANVSDLDNAEDLLKKLGGDSEP